MRSYTHLARHTPERDGQIGTLQYQKCTYIEQITYESYDNTYYTYKSSDFCPPSVGVCVLVVGSLLFASTVQPLQSYKMILQSFKEVPVTVNPIHPIAPV